MPATITLLRDGTSVLVARADDPDPDATVMRGHALRATHVVWLPEGAPWLAGRAQCTARDMTSVMPLEENPAVGVVSLVSLRETYGRCRECDLERLACSSCSSVYCSGMLSGDDECPACSIGCTDSCCVTRCPSCLDSYLPRRYRRNEGDHCGGCGRVARDADA